MIEMSMRQDDCRWRNAATESCLRGVNDRSRAAWKSRIDQHPQPARATDEIDIYETDRQPADIGSNARDESHAESLARSGATARLPSCGFRRRAAGGFFRRRGCGGVARARLIQFSAQREVFVFQSRRFGARYDGIA